MIFQWGLIFAGLGIGLVMTAPIGPVNFLAIHRTLHHGRLVGITVGLGAAIADAIFAGIAIYGLKAVAEFIEEYRGVLQVSGGVLLIIFGLYLLRHVPASTEKPKDKPRTFKSLAAGFALTITNPGSFFGFMAMFSGLTDVVVFDERAFLGTNIILGVVLGAMLWWVLLTSLVHNVSKKMTNVMLFRINQIAGAIIFIAGAILVGRYVIDYL